MEKELEMETILSENGSSNLPLIKGKHVFISDGKQNGVKDNLINSQTTVDGANGKFENCEKDTRMSKVKICWNLVVFSLSFVLLISALTSFSSIQSTVNIKYGLGTTGLATLYITMVVTSLFVTTVTLPKLSYKRMAIISMLPYVCFVATGFYSTWYTYIPASVLIGLGASHLWPTQQSYVSRLATMYAKQTNTNDGDAERLFFGIYYGFYSTCRIWGNLCSSLVFGKANDSINLTDARSHCGAHFCATNAQNKNDTTIIQPDQRQVYVFAAFCVTISCLAVISIIVFLTDVPSPKPKTNYSVCNTIQKVVCLILTSRDQHLLIAITILGGMIPAFLAGDFTVAFISCPYGVGTIGFVLTTYGVCCSICSFAVGKVSKYTGTLLLFFIGIGMQTAAALTMLLWPLSQTQAIVYVIVVLWSVGEAVYQPLTSALYCRYFKDNLETALSSKTVLNAVGWALSYSYSSWICMDKKIYILLAFLSISMSCLVILNYKHRKSPSVERRAEI